MQISKREINQLRKLTDLCRKIIDKAESWRLHTLARSTASGATSLYSSSPGA